LIDVYIKEFFCGIRGTTLELDPLLEFLSKIDNWASPVPAIGLWLISWKNEEKGLDL
jgi:hypothetical protein